MKKLKFILSGGGTGGHIYPAIAIADQLREEFPDCELLFVGATDKMEMQKIPQAGYQIKGLWISGIQRKLSFTNLLFPIKLASSLLVSFKILWQVKPDVVIGTGGFASGPLLKAAAMLGIPTLLQEQNSYPGITNKWLSKKANTICVAYENLDRFFPKNKIVLTGNPVRQDLIYLDGKREEAFRHFALQPGKKTLLVLGGSLGAKRINELIASQIKNFLALDIQVFWQCGTFYYEQYEQYNNMESVTVLPYIDRMELAYAAADYVISRAGASSVSELCLVGKPILFIPSPNVAEDHQTKNARAIVDKGGALMIAENKLSDDFVDQFNLLVSDHSLQHELGLHCKKLAKPNATQDIVAEIKKLINKSDRRIITPTNES